MAKWAMQSKSTDHVVVEGVGIGVDHGDRVNHGVVQRRQQLSDGYVHRFELALAVSHLAYHGGQAAALQRRREKKNENPIKTKEAAV